MKAHPYGDPPLVLIRRPWHQRNRHLIPRRWWLRHWRDAPWAFRSFVLSPVVERRRARRRNRH